MENGIEDDLNHEQAAFLDVNEAVSFLENPTTELYDKLIQDGVRMGYDSVQFTSEELDMSSSQTLKADEDGLLVLSSHGIHVAMFHYGREEGTQAPDAPDI